MAIDTEFAVTGVKQHVLALFDYVDDMIDAINALKHAGFADLVTFSPIPLHDVEHALEHGREKRPNTMAAIIKAVRERDFHVVRFTFLGMLGGISLAWLLMFGTALAWPIPGGGMPIIALPPIGLITYEMGTLGAALGTIAGFLFLSKLPTMKDEVYDISVGSDKFAIAIKDLDSEQIEVARRIMTGFHAVSVEEKTGVLR